MEPWKEIDSRRWYACEEPAVIPEILGLSAAFSSSHIARNGIPQLDADFGGLFCRPGPRRTIANVQCKFSS